MIVRSTILKSILATGIAIAAAISHPNAASADKARPASASSKGSASKGAAFAGSSVSGTIGAIGQALASAARKQ